MKQPRRVSAPAGSTGVPVPDPKEREAQAYALEEIERLNTLLAQEGVPPVSPIERPMLLTYIKAKRLGLLAGDSSA